MNREVRFGTTILQPPLLTYQALSVPTLIYFQTQLRMVFILVLLQLIMKLISQYREVGLKTERKKKAQRAPETDEAQDGSASTGIVARPTVHSVFTSGSFELCPYLKHRETPFHRLILNKINRFLDKVHPPKQQQETKHRVLDKMQQRTALQRSAQATSIRFPSDRQRLISSIPR